MQDGSLVDLNSTLAGLMGGHSVLAYSSVLTVCLLPAWSHRK